MIKEYLEEMANLRGRMGGNLMEWFVLRNGKEFKPYDHPFRMGRMKECFSNATNFIFNQDVDAEFSYCEGFAVSKGLGILIHHAWVVDGEGRAIDLTWPHHMEAQYYGVVFTRGTLEEQIVKNEVYGLLDVGMYNIDLMSEIDSETITHLQRMKEARNHWKEFANQK